MINLSPIQLKKGKKIFLNNLLYKNYFRTEPPIQDGEQIILIYIQLRLVISWCGTLKKICHL